MKKLVDPAPLPKLVAAPEGLGELSGPEDDVSEGEALAAPAPAAEAPTPSRTAPLSVVRLEDGRLRIEAPPALAAPLAELLESLARSLRAQ